MILLERAISRTGGVKFPLIGAMQKKDDTMILLAWTKRRMIRVKCLHQETLNSFFLIKSIEG
jgi:hypothetical protein